MTTPDLIDRLAIGGSDVDVETIASLRRPIAREQAQHSYESLFSPIDDTAFLLRERWLLAAFATRLTNDDATATYYAEQAVSADAEFAPLVLGIAREADVPGPYGVYPEAGLASENIEGLRFSADSTIFGLRLAAALDHVHLLVKRPRETNGADHQRLVDAGWSADAIVTLSQLVAFLAFQQRVAAGLRVLAEEVSA